MFGIIFSVPMSFACGAIYSNIVGKIILKWNNLTQLLRALSGIILALSVLEVIGVSTVGALKLREVIGIAYYPIHSILFFLTLPSLVNILKIQRRTPFLSKWYFIGFACAIIGLGIVLLQYDVSEALFGVN